MIGSLKDQVFLSVRWTALGVGIKAALQVAQIVVLARLLSPEEFGVYALTMVFIGYLTIFADAGVNASYVQRRSVSDEERSSLFWLNIAVCSVLVLVLSSCSDLIADFMAKPQLAEALMLAPFIVLVGAMGVQIKLTAEKGLEFGGVVKTEIFSAVTGFCITVYLALSGYGVLAPVLGSLVASTVATISFWAFLSNGWRPIFRLSGADISSHLNFGFSLVGNNLVNEFNRSFDLLIGGKFLSASALGYYSLPRQVIFRTQSLINPILTRVAFPLIAKIQDDQEATRNVFLKVINVAAFVNAPLYVALALFSEEIVAVFFGSEWLSASGLLTMLAAWGFLRSIGNPVGSLLLGKGKASLALRWNLAITICLVPTLYVGVAWEEFGLSIALIGLTLVFFVPGWRVLVYPLTGIKLNEYLLAAFRPFFIALMAGGMGCAMSSFFVFPVAVLTAGLLLSIFFYALLSYYFNRELLVELVQLLPRSLRNKKC